MTSKISKLLFLILVASPFATSQSGPIPATYFGMNAMYDFPNPCSGCSEDNSLQSYGINYGSFRVNQSFLQWNNIEPNPPANWPACEPSSCNHVYNWTYVDSAVKGTVANGTKDFYVDFGFTPTWASTNPTAGNCNEQENNAPGTCYAPKYWSDWTSYITALLQRIVADGGTVTYTECWNEPESGTWQDTAANLVTLCSYAYTTVHTVIPGAKLMSPSGFNTAATWETYMNAGLGNYIDGTAWHPYPGTTTTMAPESIISAVAEINTTNANYPVMAGKPIIDSESSWYEASWLPNATDQAAYVSRKELVEWQTGVLRNYWFSWDTNEGLLLNSPGSGAPCCSLTSAGAAYQQVFNWINGATETSACALSSNVWSCGFTEANNKTALAVWLNACSGGSAGGSGYAGCALPNTATQSYTIPTGKYADYRDLSGNTNTVSSAATSVTIGEEPILLEVSGATPGTPNPAPPTGLTASVN